MTERSSTILPSHKFAAHIDGRRRAVVENVSPQVDAGRFPIKRCTADKVVVEADVFTDGHDSVRARLHYRRDASATWTEVEMQPLGNDRWRASFEVAELGRYYYTVSGWVDHFLTWRRELQRREDNADILIALKVGATLYSAAAGRAKGDDAKYFAAIASELQSFTDAAQGKARALDAELALRTSRYPDRTFETRFETEFPVTVDPPLARFGAWYEFFPRSSSSDPKRGGTFKDCEAHLPYVAQMGFDIVYFPPIHPIGRSQRKGPNNSLKSGKDDPGSPWAIGAKEGGHREILSELGTLDDFHRLVKSAREHNIELALDIAFQCAPDHPYVSEHPRWFKWRPDGTVQYAENPPKKYQDIYPFDFETDDWEALHRELTDVVLYWVKQGVNVFRVDNPHTKAFTLWESLIGTVKQQHPQVIFLAEAFTRPRVMHRLAKAGFSQSYTYFTWRNTKWELEQYFTELTQSPGREYFRPNVWPNTPDILPEYLQIGGRAAFMTRALLASTLSATYGIYGPAFELQEHEPRDPGSEEYRDSEKYQQRSWDLDARHSLRDFITRLNRIRRENPALQADWSLQFLTIDNEQMIAYSKTSESLDDVIVVVANLDPYHAHSGWLQLPLEKLGLKSDRAYRVHDLLSGASYLWHGTRNFVQLDPNGVVGHIFRVRKHVRSEHEFDYFL